MTINQQNQLSKKEQIELIIDFFHRNMMHHAMWYAEVIHQFGREKALEILEKVYESTKNLQMQRLSKVFGFELEEGIPVNLLEKDEETILKIKEAAAINWLATDGIWFQAVEFTEGMNDAKRCNDSCWGQFSPFEAWSIKRFLKLPDHSGLEGLKAALNFRLYSTINKQSVGDEKPGSFVFYMNECRVQSARKRKGLDDYPCKSGGMIEYKSFATAIDPRIRTECLGCPPDRHPDEWFCAWKFSI